jgi:plasmid maintenance system antidote protein VapI
MTTANIRNSIVRAMGREGITANALAVRVARDVSRSLVYDFITGKHDLTSEKASHLLKALRLTIVAK